MDGKDESVRALLVAVSTRIHNNIYVLPLLPSALIRLRGSH